MPNDICSLKNLCHVLGISHEYPQIIKQEWKSILSEHDRIKLENIILYHRKDNFDSEMFGKNVGKVEYTIGSNIRIIKKSILALQHAEIYDYIIFRLPSNQLSWIQAIERAGGITLDTSIDLICTDISNYRLNSKFDFSDDVKKYRNQIIECAQSFTHGRFFTDPKYPLGEKIYTQWIKNALSNKAADKTFIVAHQKKLAGFVSITHKKIGSKKYIYIPLIAKHPKCDKKGIGMQLINKVIEYTQKNHFDAIVLGTQISNIKALHLYFKTNFVPFSSNITLRTTK